MRPFIVISFKEIYGCLQERSGNVAGAEGESRPLPAGLASVEVRAGGLHAVSDVTSDYLHNLPQV